MSAVPVPFASVLRCVIVAALLALGACGDNDQTPIVPDTSVDSTGRTMNLTGTAGSGGDRAGSDYRLGPNDRTRIIVYGQPNLTGEFALDGSGNLSFPLIGNVQANGMTPTELQRAIAAKLDPDYLHNPSVSVEVATRRPFYVVGEVQKPGSYPFVTDMSVLEAIATAGGETYRANMGHFYIKRQVDGRVVRVYASQESRLQPGDTVVVKERYF